MTEPAAVIDVLAAIKHRQLHRARSFEKNWLPDDPLFQPQEWKKIKDSLEVLSPSVDFGSVSDDLMICVGNYRATVMKEMPKNRYVSEPNRKKMRRCLKVLNGIKGVFAGDSTMDVRTQEIYKKEVLSLLQNRSLQHLVSCHDVSAYEKISDIILWLEKGAKNVGTQEFCYVVDVIMGLLEKQVKNASKKGAPAKHARGVILPQLADIWNKATGSQAKASKTFDRKEVVSLFCGFVEAVLFPVSEQLHDKTDVCAIRDAVWDYCNKKAKNRKTTKKTPFFTTL